MTATDTSEGIPSPVLAGVRVVEFAQNAAIPHCGRLLAGLGADVVKVEPPEGDAMRKLAMLGQNESRAYATINPGKRSVAIDLTTPAARDVIDRLFAWADVALVAFKLPDLERYGLHWEHARTVNPQLVHLTHTALGPEGPDADQGGYDVLVQGRSGLGFMMNRAGTSAPQTTRPAINDFSTGFTSAFAVMAGLRHRDKTGEGQRIDSSLLGTAISLGTPIFGRFPVDDAALAELDADLDDLRSAGVDFETQREVYDSRMQPAQGAFQLYFRHYQTADGIVSVAGMSQSLWSKFHAVTGLPKASTDDLTDGSFAELVADAEKLFLTRTTQDWLDSFREVGYPAGPYNLPHEAATDPQVVANEFIVEVDHPSIGRYETAGMPVQFERTPTVPPRPSPRFAEHTAAVMAELGLPADRIATLTEDGTVVCEHY